MPIICADKPYPYPLIDELANLEEPVENVTYETDSEGNYTTTYRAVTNWVKFKTEIDLIYARYFGNAFAASGICRLDYHRETDGICDF